MWHLVSWLTRLNAGMILLGGSQESLHQWVIAVSYTHLLRNRYNRFFRDDRRDAIRIVPYPCLLCRFAQAGSSQTLGAN